MFQADTASTLGVRVDTGVYEGGEIPMYYDSMIAKLIVHGSDRQDAIEKMREALNGFVIRGVSSNIPFQAALLAHPQFVSGDFNTGFIAEHYSHGFVAEDVPHDDPNFLVAVASFIRRKSRERTAQITGQLPGYGVKLGQDYVGIVMGVGGKNRHVPVHIDEIGGEVGVARVTIDGKTYDISSGSRISDGIISGECNGAPFTAQVDILQRVRKQWHLPAWSQRTYCKECGKSAGAESAERPISWTRDSRSLDRFLSAHFSGSPDVPLRACENGHELQLALNSLSR